MDRKGLATALAAWRARLAPADVGLPAGTRRRTPGLRREEVAQLAGISVDYVSRMEQGRGAHPSASVLGALARALRLDETERDHLYTLAGVRAPDADSVPSLVRPSVRRLLDRFADLPAVLLDAKGTVLAWNPLAAALLGDFSKWPVEERNLLWQRFLGDHDPVAHDDEAATDLVLVGELQTVAARYPADPELRSLIAKLRKGSRRFAVLWEQQIPAYRHTATKQVVHPELGRIELNCDALVVPETDQKIVIYSAEPGSPGAQALDLLRVIGIQRMSQDLSQRSISSGGPGLANSQP